MCLIADCLIPSNWDTNYCIFLRWFQGRLFRAKKKAPYCALQSQDAPRSLLADFHCGLVLNSINTDNFMCTGTKIGAALYQSLFHYLSCLGIESQTVLKCFNFITADRKLQSESLILFHFLTETRPEFKGRETTKKQTQRTA